MNLETLTAVVYQDLLRSDLGEFFTGDQLDGDRFELLSNGDRQPMVCIDNTPGQTNGAPYQAMVAWRFRGRNTAAVPGLQPMKEVVVTVEGVSYVDWKLRTSTLEATLPGHELNLDGIIVRRFIDWADVYAQLGSLPGPQIYIDDHSESDEYRLARTK